MIKLYFIRHLKTKGNYERKYIGRTDEELADVSSQEVWRDVQGDTPVFSSPMRRCLQTAQLITPEATPTIIEEFKEINFGDFENKCYEELKDNPDYIRFIDSNGSGSIPNGEEATEFKKRCCVAFLQMIDLLIEKQQEEALIVCHGGTIMSIMERFDEDAKSFYDYQVKNGSGYEAEFDIEKQKIKIVKELIG